jgi:redox-regulated HSP33 family molecular chaperone
MNIITYCGSCGGIVSIEGGRVEVACSCHKEHVSAMLALLLEHRQKRHEGWEQLGEAVLCQCDLCRRTDALLREVEGE